MGDGVAALGICYSPISVDVRHRHRVVIVIGVFVVRLVYCYDLFSGNTSVLL